ncbi:MAG: acylphosphatase [Flavobacteriales bacterium]|jgi:acylphosphatase|nr:acylphosphatase [Flavobacteriales bacterium]
MQAVSIIVSGRVQGVWFRKCTSDKAIELGISGTVKNLPKGDVQIEAIGTKDQLELFEKWCWTGSPLSKVETVKVTEIVLQPTVGFSIVG